MLLKNKLQEVVRAQRNELLKYECGVPREKLKDINIDIPFAIIISGIRRCGKSTLLRQIMKKTKNFYYFNFEDPRATGFEVGDFQKLNDIFKEEFGVSNYYFFDEIQNIEKWELFVRKMLENKKHIIITGSNASLLSKELGTKLTGRHLRFELYPFSYEEYLKFYSKKLGGESFLEYLTFGGFPEYLKYLRNDILQELFNDIITRDIVVRYKLRNLKSIKEMALYLISNVGSEFTYTNLAKMFNLGSTNSAIDYVSYLEDSYILFVISKFDYSLKKQAVNPKKVYCIDSGLLNANSIAFSPKKGRLIENQVFLNLKRLGNEIYYFKNKNECDFVIKEKNKIVNAIQVCYELNDDNKEREINGLLEAMEKFDLDKGTILTYNQEDILTISGKTIFLIPVWKWMKSTN